MQLSAFTPHSVQFAGKKPSTPSRSKSLIDSHISRAIQHEREVTEPHLLSQLKTASQQLEKLEIKVSKSSQDNALRFFLPDPDSKGYLQVGLSSYDTTGWIFKGKPILGLFAFFDSPNPDGHLRDSLYNSALYTANAADRVEDFNPFRLGIKQRLKLKAIDNFGNGRKLYEHGANRTDRNPALEKQLLALVLKAAQQSGEQDALKHLIQTGSLKKVH